jgi:hypothetical protein
MESDGVPITAPAGAKQLAAEEKDEKHDDAGRGEAQAQNRRAVSHAEGLRKQVAEELADIVLHAHYFAMTMPTGKNRTNLFYR